MAATGFEVDQRTADAIADLRGIFGVKTNADVVRKALTLAQIISREANDDHTITVSGKAEPIVIVLDK